MICIDGCFNHRHLAERGNCPDFYTGDYFLSKEFVDQVGARIDAARKNKKAKGKKKKRSKLPKKKKAAGNAGASSSSSSESSDDEATRGHKVPAHAVRACKESHEAGSGSNVKTYMEQFDDAGLMAAVCRHDIPLFVCNIDTPGEQQKYAVALIQHILSLVPQDATLTVLYDVGCVLDRSREKVRFWIIWRPQNHLQFRPVSPVHQRRIVSRAVRHCSDAFFRPPVRVSSSQ